MGPDQQLTMQSTIPGVSNAPGHYLLAEGRLRDVGELQGKQVRWIHSATICDDHPMTFSYAQFDGEPGVWMALEKFNIKDNGCVSLRFLVSDGTMRMVLLPPHHPSFYPLANEIAPGRVRELRLEPGPADGDDPDPADGPQPTWASRFFGWISGRD